MAGHCGRRWADAGSRDKPAGTSQRDASQSVPEANDVSASWRRFAMLTSPVLDLGAAAECCCWVPPPPSRRQTGGGGDGGGGGKLARDP